MAHMLDTSTGTAACYSLLENPWHKLGNVVNTPASDPRILELAGLDWQVALRPAWTSDADGNPVMIPGRRGVIRSDTSACLGSVGDQYQAFQNDRMLDFFRQVCDQDAVIETAGALDKGERVWALAKIPHLHQAIGKDVSNGYLLITNRHDGTAALKILPTTIRVVCNNTLTAALGGFDRLGKADGFDGRRNVTGNDQMGYRIRHTGQLDSSVEQVATQYAEAIAQWHAQAEALETLVTVPGSIEQTIALARAAFADTEESIKDEKERAKTMREAREARIASIRQSATCNVEGTAGTLYSDFQAVTEYIDHNANKDPSYGLMGSGVEKKAEALAAALALV